MKRVLAALSGSSKKSTEKARRRLEAQENADSPLVPKRLLSPMPASGLRGRSASLALADVNGTPRSLNYDRSPPRVRPAATSAGPRASPRPAAPTPARTPARGQSRFAQQAADQEGGPAYDGLAAAAAAAGTDPAASSDNIRVVVRVRPRNERELSLGGGMCVQPLGSAAVRVASHPEPHSFSFDYVAGDGTDQETIFQVAGRPIVENCLAGYNGCIFAYGQTGSGKTFTMLGAGEVDETGTGGRGDVQRGLIQRVFEHLFARMAQGGGKHLLECSFLEIYNETITDLLDPSRTNLQVRENLEGQYVSNLTAHEVYRVEDVVALLRMGQANRRVGETNMNERSSRSHSVFTCKLQSKTVDSYGATHIRTARLHLVDLAGSERQKASGAQGERLKEATAINKSLSALGNVIMSLVDQQHGRARHIPYRDSRLTYLLQDSLGGNAKTCLVATVSSASVNMAETLSTLRFADQAKRIKNQAVVNEDTDGDRAALKREIKRLQEELAAARRVQAQPAVLSAASGSTAAAAGVARGSGSGVGGMAAEQKSGTPARLEATADAMLAAASPSAGEAAARRAALMGALRREDAAFKDVKRLEAELEGMRGLLKAKESDLQRAQMMMKLKESRLSRLQSGSSDAAAEVADLQREIELLRAKVEAHPEVKRFAVENLKLSEEVRRYEGIVKRQELHALHVDVDALRSEMLALEGELKRAQGEGAIATEQMAATRRQAEMAAESIRAKAVEETEAKAAVELSQLRQQLLEQQHAAREAEGRLSAAARDKEELAAQVALLQETVEQLESSHAALRGELSPVKRQARHYEHDLTLARQETMAAKMHASSEATLRSQAELATQQLQTQLAAVQAEAAAMRASNQELLRANSDAEEQRELAVGVEAELGLLRSQLERQQAAAAEQQASHADALNQLDSSRQRTLALEQEVQTSQQELLEAQAELLRQQAEHEAAQTAAAARRAAAAKAAEDLQGELDSRSARVAELQAAQEQLQGEVEDLTQRCTQLHDEKGHLSSMLAQRDNELQEMEASLEEKDAQLEQHRACAARLEGELDAAQADLAARAGELAAASAELEANRAKLAEVTAAMQDAHEQLTELQDRLTVVEEQHAQAEYELSDKSASLSEAQEQLAEVRRQLAEVRQAQAQTAAAAAEHTKAAEDTATELEAARARAAELAAALAEAEGALEAQQAVAQVPAAALAAREAELEAQRSAAGAAEQQASELAAQLRQLQLVTLVEKEQQLLLGRAEVKELREQLAAQDEAAEKLRAQLEARDADVARLRHDMAAEVSEAAQQVQQLLAAQGRVAALEEELAAAQQAAEEKDGQCAQLPLRVAEAVAAARADALAEIGRLEQLLTQRDQELAMLRQEYEESQSALAEAATMTTTQAQEQIEQLVAEREAWIEEVQAQRAEATAAVESCRALERRCAELSEERASLATALAEVQERAGRLEGELTHLTGQQNLNQRIQYHKKVKEENDALREELGRLRIDHHRSQVRYERVTGELQKLRGVTGQDGLPDFESEEVLRDALAATEAQKQQLEQELEQLAKGVLALAPREARPAQHAGQGPAGAGEEGEGDIVLELCTPRAPAPPAASSGPSQAGQTAGPATSAAAARRALADISAQQAAAARSLEDSRHQIRLLKESSKLARLRRASAAVTTACATGGPAQQ